MGFFMSKLQETAGNGKAGDIVKKVLSACQESYTLKKLGRGV